VNACFKTQTIPGKEIESTNLVQRESSLEAQQHTTSSGHPAPESSFPIADGYELAAAITRPTKASESGEGHTQGTTPRLLEYNTISLSSKEIHRTTSNALCEERTRDIFPPTTLGTISSSNACSSVRERNSAMVRCAPRASGNRKVRRAQRRL
jgi:hypothetical protein